MALSVGYNAKKNVTNLWFVCFLLCSAIVIIVKFMYHTGYIIYHPHWFKLNYPTGILRPVLIYLYIYFLLDNGEKKINYRILLHFLPSLALLLYMMPFYIQNSEFKTAVLSREIINTYGLIPSWFLYFQFMYSIVYFLAIYFFLLKYKKTHSKPNRSQKAMVNWVSLLLIGGFIYISTAFILRVFSFAGDYNYYLYEVFSVMLIFLCIKLFTLSELFSANQSNLKKYKNSALTNENIEAYFNRINDLMVDDNLFKRTDLKLKHIAEELNLPEYLISQIINQKSGQSFRHFLNAFRIEKAKIMLLDSYDQYSIEGIAKDVGFNSRASFYNAFKKETSLTPSEYLLQSK